MRGFKTAAMCGLVMAALLAVGQDDGVLLRRELKEGATDTYRFVFRTNQDIEIEGMAQTLPSMGFITKMNMAVGVKNIDDEKKTANVDVHITDLEMDLGEMAGMVGGMTDQMPREMRVSARLDERNRLTGMTMPGMQGGMAMMMGPGMGAGPMFIEFPEKAVKVGDSWPVTIPASPLTGGKDASLTATLTGELVHNDIPAYQIALKGRVPLEGDLSQMMQGGAAGMMGDMKLLMKGWLDMNGQAFVEKTTGRTLQMEVLMNSKQDVEMPDMGMRLNIVGSSSMQMGLAEQR